MSRSIRHAQLVTGAVVATLALPLGAAPAGAAALTTSAPKPCVSSGCKVVSRADVDGDGRADTVSLTRQSRGAWHTLRVVTARGAVSSVKISTSWLWSGQTPFLGAVALDGQRGAELVILTGTGAHTAFHRVYTWRSGRLVAEKDPSGSTTWTTDGAAAFARGYTLRTVKGAPQLTSIDYARDSWGDTATFSGRRIVAQWKNGRWTAITDRHVVVKEGPAVWRGAGWNVKGIARF